MHSFVYRLEQTFSIAKNLIILLTNKCPIADKELVELRGKGSEKTSKRSNQSPKYCRQAGALLFAN
jgi:hypothetical protein